MATKAPSILDNPDIMSMLGLPTRNKKDKEDDNYTAPLAPVAKPVQAAPTPAAPVAPEPAPIKAPPAAQVAPAAPAKPATPNPADQGPAPATGDIGEIGNTQDQEDAAAGPAARGETSTLSGVDQNAQGATPEEEQTRLMDKSRLPPAAQKELSNPDLPYAKAAAWNAFFGNMLRKPGGRQGGFSDAVAAYSNTYGRSLQKFSDAEAEYNAQREILKKGYEDTKAQRVEEAQFDDKFIHNAVKSSNGDLNFIKNLRDTARQNGSPETGKLDELVRAMEGDKKTLSDSLLAAAQTPSVGGGNITKTDIKEGYAKIGNANVLVEKVTEVQKNGKVSSVYRYTDPQTGQKVSTPNAPVGMQLATTFNQSNQPGVQADTQFQKKDAPAITEAAVRAQTGLTGLTEVEDVLKRKPHLFGKLSVTDITSGVGQKYLDDWKKGNLSEDQLAAAIGIKKADIADFQRAMYHWNNLAAASTKELLGGQGIGSITDFERRIAKDSYGDLNKTDPEAAKHVISYLRFKANLAIERDKALSQYLEDNPSGSHSATGFNQVWRQKSEELQRQFAKQEGLKEPGATPSSNATKVAGGASGPAISSSSIAAERERRKKGGQ